MIQQFHLAQINIARLKAPMSDPQIKEFTDFIDPVNKLGEESPGFVWRLKADDGHSSSYIETPFSEDPLMIVNMTVWEDFESLKQFVFQTVHSYFLKSRNKWFEKPIHPQAAFWWVPIGHSPTIEEAKEKLEYLEKHGPSPTVFTMSRPFDAEGNPIV
jgi:Domain of unknown function (DUF3291)